MWRWHLHNLPSPIKQRSLFTPLQSFGMCSPAPAGGKHQVAMSFGLWLARWPLLQDLFTQINDFSLQVNSGCGGPKFSQSTKESYEAHDSSGRRDVNKRGHLLGSNLSSGLEVVPGFNFLYKINTMVSRVPSELHWKQSAKMIK